MTEAVAWQLRRIEGGKPGPWGPPTKSKGVADALVAEGMDCRALGVIEPFDIVAERARFEAFLGEELLFSELEFDPERNLYKDYRIHLAWQCWRAAMLLDKS